MAIVKFGGSHRFLSNFYPCKIIVIYGGVDGPVAGHWEMAPTVEHAYQATKAKTFTGFLHIIRQPTAARAKSEGRKVLIREDWDAQKNDVMLRLLRLKFAEDVDLINKLKATGTEELIEGNTWGDTYWGVCRGVGENWLGRLLMQVRAELIAEGA